MDRRDSIVRGLCYALVYFVVAWVAVAETRFDGGFAFIWGASAVLLAYLASTPIQHWAVGLAGAAFASVLATGLFGLGWHAALPLLAANMTEVLVTFWAKNRFGGRDAFAGSIPEVVGFAFACLLGTGAGALIAAAYLTNATGMPFPVAASNFFTGHALGLISFTPIMSYVARGEFARRVRTSSRRQAAQLAFVLGLVAIVCTAVFAQSTYPLLFLPLLPITLAAFVAGRMGAACSIVIVTVIGTWFTLKGVGPLSLIKGDLSVHVRFLQLYIASVVLCILPVAIDLSKRKELIRQVRESEARYRMIADNSTDIIMNLDANGLIRFISPAIEAVGGYTPDELIGQNAGMLIAEDHLAAVREGHMQALRGKGSVRFEYVGITKAGERRWFETHTRAVLDDLGQPSGAVSVIRDISDRKAIEDSLAEAAVTDPLTRLLNRRGFELASQKLAASSDGACIALFDIDHFKQVNDRYGHPRGDVVLQTVASLIRGRLRATDALGRLGGEEFVLLLSKADVALAELICDRMRTAVSEQAFDHDGSPFRVTVSCGIAVLRGQDIETALHEADAALYEAKNAGRNCLRFAA